MTDKEKERMCHIDKKKYQNIHQWLKNNYGSATVCESTDCLGGSKRVEWALIHGKKYEKERSNFMMLCTRCHKKYDGLGLYVSRARRGVPYTKAQRDAMPNRAGIPNEKNRTPVNMHLSGGVKRFESVSIAADYLRVARSAISNVLTGRAKTAAGYRWSYSNE